MAAGSGATGTYSLSSAARSPLAVPTAAPWRLLFLTVGSRATGTYSLSAAARSLLAVPTVAPWRLLFSTTGIPITGTYSLSTAARLALAPPTAALWRWLFWTAALVVTVDIRAVVTVVATVVVVLLPIASIGTVGRVGSCGLVAAGRTTGKVIGVTSSAAGLAGGLGFDVCGRPRMPNRAPKAATQTQIPSRTDVATRTSDAALKTFAWACAPCAALKTCSFASVMSRMSYLSLERSRWHRVQQSPAIATS
mmetsp:Transcript_8502/g.16055  ORF Transcript_8502/g.16055 Transcript_8502/m.16055 type:complete len:251 (+) Transcript_8502:666-1418(+)